MSRRLSTSQSRPAALAPAYQTFAVECPCGESVTGQRESQAQTILCPHCGQPMFVLPADCYAESARGRASSAPPAGTPSSGLIDKLNRLAFWSKLRNGRRTFGQVVRQMGRWVKRQLSRDR